MLVGLRPLGWIAVVVLLFAAWQWTEAYLIRYVGNRHTKRITPEQVHMEDVQPWMSPMVQRDLAQRVSDRLSVDPLDQKSLGLSLAALSSSPWVESVQQVRRSADRVHVRAQYRQPIAAVAGRDGYHLVDNRQVRLPGLYHTRQVPKLGLPVVVGVDAAPSGTGGVWPGEDLTAGLDVIRLLHDQPYLDQIRAFDVSGRDTFGRIRVILRTSKGMVRWGLAPGHEQAIEPDAETKKHRLGSIYRQYGSIDVGGKVVNIFGAAVLVESPQF